MRQPNRTPSVRHFFAWEFPPYWQWPLFWRPARLIPRKARRRRTQGRGRFRACSGITWRPPECWLADFPLLAYHFQKMALAKPAAIPLLYSGAMAVNGIAALVFGRLFDRFGLPVLSFGILISLLALPLGFLGGTSAAIAAVGCWATGMGVQDASLRSGIAQVVSMNKRGIAFGAFNGVYGVAWFLGSVVMGLLYDHSLMALVVFGVVAQLAAAVMFFRLRAPLAAAHAAI